MAVKVLEWFLVFVSLLYVLFAVKSGVDAQHGNGTHDLHGALRVVCACFSVVSVISMVQTKLCGIVQRDVRSGLNGNLFAWILPSIHVTNFIKVSDGFRDEAKVEYLLVLLGIAQLLIVCLLHLFLYYAGDLPSTWAWLAIIASAGNLPVIINSFLGWEAQFLIIMSSTLFLLLLARLFKTLAGTFTLGEGVVVCQAASFAGFHTAQFLQRSKYTEDSLSQLGVMESYDFTSMAAFVAMLLQVILYVTLPSSIKSVKLFYSSYVFSAAGAAYFSYSCGHLQVVMRDIISDSTKIILVIYWLCITLGAVLLVLIYNHKKWEVASTDRKYFHLLVILIFLPGVHLDPALIKMASIGAFTIFLWLEFIRYMKLPPFGHALDDCLRLFVDKQDSGSLVLTHIYLLAGCSLPLWLCPSVKLLDSELSLYSGIICLGVGDSCASVIGSKFGKLHYPGSQKTVEGTLAAWISMVVFCYLFTTPPASEMFILTGKLLLIALLESQTQQVDNLILPLYTYILLKES